jgi:hypothetical protein
MEEERINLSQRDRDRLRVLHDWNKGICNKSRRHGDCG